MQQVAQRAITPLSELKRKFPLWPILVIRGTAHNDENVSLGCFEQFIQWSLS